MQFEILGSGGGSGTGGGVQKVADATALAALSPTEGDFAIQLDTDTLYYYNGTIWEIYLDDTSYDNLLTVISDLANHIADATDAHDASAISFVPASGIAATDVQNAIVESLTDANAYTDLVTTALNNHLTDTVDAHDASAISVVPTGNLAATEVQAALNELQGDINTLTATSHVAVTTAAFGSTPNAQGLTLTGQAINLQPADNTNPGAVSTAAQNMTGEKRFSTGVQIGTTTALGASVLMGTVSTTKGTIPMPVMTTAQRTAIASPATGLMVYDSTLKGAMYYDGTVWQALDGRNTIAAAQTPAAAATLTPLAYRKQILPISGSGGAVTIADLGITNALAGDELVLIGTSDTNTVTLDSATNTVMNGSVTLGLDDSISFIFYSSKWKEVSRNA